MHFFHYFVKKATMKKTIQILIVFSFHLILAQVGINTTSPTATLDVNGNIRVRQAKNLAGLNSAKDSILVIDNSGFFNRVSADMVLSQAGTGLIGVVTDGTVAGNGKTGTPLKIAQNGAVNGQVLTWNGTSWIPQDISAGWSLAGNNGISPAANFLGTTDNQPLIFKTNSQENMRIAATGNVGIRTNSPQTSLQVNGGVSITSITVNLTADNQLITVGDASHIKLNSNNTTAANRTFTISNGLADGQIVTIYTIAGAAQLADTGNINIAGTFNIGLEDVIQLIWTGSKWLQISRSNN